MRTTECILLKIVKLLKLWRMQQLTIEGKSWAFTNVTISKVVHLALVKDMSSNANSQLEKKYKNNLFEKTKILNLNILLEK